MLAERISHWAKTTPDKVAMAHNGAAGWSYKDFADLIARARGEFFAHGLAGSGAVVLIVSHVVDFWVLALALRSLGLDVVFVRSGAQIAPLRLAALRAVVVTPNEDVEDLAAACAAGGWPLLTVSLTGARLGIGEGPEPQRPGGHILTTSGTTGAYKKVLMHPSFEPAFLRVRRELAGIGQQSAVAVFNFPVSTGIGYKSPASVWDAGGTVVFEQGHEPHRALNHPGLTHAYMSPPLAAAILAAPPDAIRRNAGLRVMIGGGPVSQAWLDQLKARISPDIHGVISATETCTFASTRLETPEDRRWHRPAPGRSLEVVDTHDRPVAPGDVGQIRVSTADGPTGYMDDEAASRAFFRGGYFYPGDLAILREDGRIALHGRVTDVINVNGDKLSPAPIEAALAEALGVPGVCLFSMQNEDAEEEVHLVVEAPAPLATEQLVAALRQALPACPKARVFFVRALPRNAMGKLMRQATRDLVRGR